MNNLIFVVFYIFLFFFGKGIVSFFKIYFSNDLYFKNLYPIFSLFLIGNINILINFFFPIRELSIILYIIYLLIAFIGFIKIINEKFEGIKLINLIVIPFLISFSSYGIKFHYDAGAYHLNFQNWTYENKIVIGLSNLNPYYSYGSIQEYIFNQFRFFELNLLFFFVELTFITSFLCFVFSLLRQNTNSFLRNSSFFILLYLFLDNFGYKGGGNGAIQIQMVSKPDTAVGTLWIIVCMLVLNNLIEKHTDEKQQFTILLFSLFAFQLKSNAAPLIFLIIYYHFIFRKDIKLFTKPNLFLVSILSIFVLKNILISGCLLFPIISSCINSLSWTNYAHLLKSASNTVTYNKRYEFGENFIEWINEFINHAYNLQIFLNFLFSIIIIFLVKKILFKTIAKNTKLKLSFIIFVTANFILFFLTVPAFRNAFGYFLSLILIFAIDDLKIRDYFKKYFNKFTITALILVVVLLFPRFFMYSEAKINNFNLTDFKIESVDYIKFSEKFVTPKNTNQCWYQKNCILKTGYNNKFSYSEIFGYQVYVSSK